MGRLSTTECTYLPTYLNCLPIAFSMRFCTSTQTSRQKLISLLIAPYYFAFGRL